jgi:hypothetical protein
MLTPDDSPASVTFNFEDRLHNGHIFPPGIGLAGQLEGSGLRRFKFIIAIFITLLSIFLNNLNIQILLV